MAANLDVLFTTLRTVLEFLFRVGKSPTVASELVEILNGTMERAIQAKTESKCALVWAKKAYELTGL